MTYTTIKPFQLIVIALLGILVWQQYSVRNALQQPITQNPEKEVGRYQLLQLGSMRRDQFMVDTKTGRVWTIVCHSSQSKNKNNNSVTPQECASEGLEAIEYLSDGEGFLPAPMTHEEYGIFLQEEADRARTNLMALMEPEELTAFKLGEEIQCNTATGEAARLRAEKMPLMNPTELIAFKMGDRASNCITP
jgi:hypothetical protein